MADQYDVIVLGSGPGGYVAAIRTGASRPYVLDGADGAALMAAFKALVEMPLGLVA